jgi:ureidoglycolate dehydrogenase (NAD+)
VNRRRAPLRSAAKRTIHVESAELQNVCTRAFQCAGVRKRDANIAAASLVDANLCGIDSHGVIRLPRYVRGLRSGSINPRPNIALALSAPAVVRVDGDNGLGAVVATRAMRELIRICKLTGIAAAGVYSSNHYGTISYHLRKAAAEGLIGIGFVHGEALQVPFGGSEAFFGTNPLAFVFPASPVPVTIDFATSATTFGKIMQARALKKKLPAGETLDQFGSPTTDAMKAARIKPAAGHKGYGLALAVEVFSAILNGSPFGPHVPPFFRENVEVPGELGHLFIALDPARFCGARTFRAGITKMIQELHSSKPSKGFDSVLVPGEPEASSYKHRSSSGIPLSADLWSEIQQLSHV